ncbi:MAG: hypothetical protein OXC44_03290 [Proteobacteria bacterium]|nr:hypothetical protein [Pseudomonadota bacterium]
MKKISHTLKNYRERHQVMWPSLRELSEYARSNGNKVNIYDHYGYKMDMRHLDASQTLIKSWGGVNFSNTNSPQGTGLFVASKGWNALFPKVIHSYPKPPSLYQPAQLISSTSFDKQYSARLFINDQTKKRTIVVVKHNGTRKDPIWLHDAYQPEEFIWFPGSRLLAFTSHPEYSPKGPLHIYDVDHDELRRIKFDSGVEIDHKQRWRLTPYVAALAGAENDKLYVYLVPYISKPLSPKELFHPNNLYRIRVTISKGDKFRAVTQRLEGNGNSHLLRREYSSPKFGKGNTLQKTWFSLKVVGNLERNIKKWQDFVVMAQEENSPMSGYGLVTLISLYEKAARIYVGNPGSHGDSFQNYALDYAKLVAQHPIHPTWLRLIGWDSWERLKAGQSTLISEITPKSRERWD